MIEALQDRVLTAWMRVPEALRVRVLPGVLLAGSGTVLGIAAWLTPDPQGHATHLQLGLNSCTFLTATGHPCPVCGATTTFALWAHLRPIDAILNQPFASLLFWMTVATFAVSLVEIVHPNGRWERFWAWMGPREIPLVGGFVAIMIASWIYKIWLMSP